MAYQVQLRGGSQEENDAFTGAPKELTVNTTDWSLRIHDGVTAGGHPISGGNTDWYYEHYKESNVNISDVSNLFLGSFAPLQREPISIEAYQNTLIIGQDAGNSLIAAEDTIILGNTSLNGSSNVSDLIVIGSYIVESCPSISHSTVIGNHTLNNASSGVYGSVVIGSSVLITAPYVLSTTFVGQGAGYIAEGINYSTAIGESSLGAAYNHEFTTAIGSHSGYNATNGGNNTYLGYRAGIFTANSYNATCLGYDAAVTGSNQVQLGNAHTTTYAYGAVQDRSDIRDKADIQDTSLGLAFIEALRPVDYKWDMRDSYRTQEIIKLREVKEGDAPLSDEEIAQYKEALAAQAEKNKLANITHDGTHKRSRFHHGFIAQDVQALIEKTGQDFGGFQDHSLKGGDDVKSLGYIEFIAPLVKAVQELSAKVRVLEAQLAAKE